MKNRMNKIVMAVLVIMAALVWAVARSQRNTIKTIASAPEVSVETPQPAKVEILVVPTPIPLQSTAKVVPQEAGDETARAVTTDPTKHVAQPGETVTSLATDLLGKDSKTNRDAIVNANPSLQADPDNLVAGKTYHVPSPSEIRAAAQAPEAEVAATPVIKPAKQPVQAEPTTELKYTAAPGDTVTTMAQAFLGGDGKSHQDAIVNANPSLKDDPDHVVVGKAYKIPAPDGLSAAAPTEIAARPTTQPDADQVVLASSPRALRYTAKPGDTVTTLAIQLLGSDTQQARDAIISNNPDLKRNPDRVIAGQTYWIPAPSATATVQTP